MWQSFFRVFDYRTLMHDAIDQGLVYDEVIITKDILTTTGINLTKGDQFHQVNLNLHSATFDFICWQRAEDSEDGIIRPTRLVTIPQSELAPFLKW